MSIAASLTVTKDGTVVRTCALVGELNLGRSKDSDIRLDDQAVSRQHAVFRWEGANLHLEKKSEFGALLVNGMDCTSARLSHADLIVIGPYVIKISMETEKSNTGPSITASATDSSDSSSTGEPGQLDASSTDGLLDGSLDGSLDSPLEDGPLDESLKGSDGPAFDSLPPSENNNSDGQELDFKPDAGNEIDAGDKVQEVSPENSLEEPLGASLEVEASDLIADDGKTKFTPASTLRVRLIFETGTANVTEYNITEDETSIGRGKDCDIVLNDKKSSRKNSVIRKAGPNFLIKDLSSSNGTFVNGAKVDEHELSGDDLIKIGGVQFQFKAESADYARKEQGFMAVDKSAEDAGFDLAIPEEGMAAQSDLIPEEFRQQELSPVAQAFPNPLGHQVSPNFGNTGGLGSAGNGDFSNSIPGITGMGESSHGKRTLLSRFRALPKRTQIIGTIAMILFFMFLAEEDPPGTKKKKSAGKKVAAAGKNADGSKIITAPVSFDGLTVEQKQFVEAQHTLAFDYYKNKEYDKTLFEIGKIFALIPDYKDAREIERYAKEGKRKIEALEEERKKKEEEAQLKDKIAHLLEDARKRMLKKEYEQMSEFFTQILALDPDNASVALWRKEIEAFDEEAKLKLQQIEVLAAIRKNAWATYKQALQVKKAGKYHTAINIFKSAIELGPNEKKMIVLAKEGISRCRALISRAREPVLAKAKMSEDAGDFFNAFNLYKRATQIDPPHPTGHSGMSRIKGILHDRSKLTYTEAIIAESYSDFANAKRLFKKCLDNSPVDDLYHERAARKLAHYYEKPESPQP